MKKLVLILALILIINLPAAATDLDDLLSGEFIIETLDREESEKSMGFLSRLNLEVEKKGWTNGFHIDFDLSWDLQKEDFEIELNEAYYDHMGETYDLRVGRQLVEWGAAVKINPSDNLNPVKQEDFLTDDKKPIFMFAGNYYLKNNLKLTGIVIPYHEPAKEELILPGGGTLTARPVEKELKNMEYAIKYSGKGINGFDYSFSFFDGYEDFPTLLMKKTPAGQVPDSAYYRQYSIIGADLATSIEGIGLWFEGAYFIPADGENYYNLVFGGDYKLKNNLYLEGQLIYQKDQYKYNDILVQTVLEKPVADIHTIRFGSIFNSELSGYLLLPEAEFSLGDSLSLKVGYRYSRGDLFNSPVKSQLIADHKGMNMSIHYHF